MRQNIELREDGGTIRKDILQLLVKFRNDNDIEAKDKFSWHIENMYESEKLLSIKKMARISEYLMENCMVTIASTSVFTLYELLKQPELMEKVRQEILMPTEKQEISYQKMKQMKFLDLCIQGMKEIILI